MKRLHNSVRSNSLAALLQPISYIGLCIRFCPNDIGNILFSVMLEPAVVVEQLLPLGQVLQLLLHCQVLLLLVQLLPLGQVLLLLVQHHVLLLVVQLLVLLQVLLLPVQRQVLLLVVQLLVLLQVLLLLVGVGAA